MGFNDDFFSYVPVALGVVIDVEQLATLRNVRSALVGYVSGLPSIVEDKVVFYDKLHSSRYPRAPAEAVSQIASYNNLGVFNVESALLSVQTSLADVSGECRKYLVYITERSTESQARRFARVLDQNRAYDLDVRFLVFDVGADNPGLMRVCESSEDADYWRMSSSYLTTSKLKEIIDG